MLNDRFWMKVDKNTPNSCWEWTSNKNNKGCGLFKVNAAVGNRLAHRLSYRDAKGPIPKDALVLHSCDNPACVNPSHLRLGSHKMNAADRETRQRHPHRPMVGEKNAFSKLSNQQVIAIRKACVSGETREAIAAAYNLSPLSIHDITSGKSWPHLLGADGSPTIEELKAALKFRKKSAAKIDQTTANEIRKRLADGELGKDLAAEYGIHKATISDIKLRKIWAD